MKDEGFLLDSIKRCSGGVVDAQHSRNNSATGDSNVLDAHDGVVRCSGLGSLPNCSLPHLIFTPFPDYIGSFSRFQ